jgi:hypothetical protein
MHVVRAKKKGNLKISEMNQPTMHAEADLAEPQLLRCIPSQPAN